jgi:hypothetical protein
MNGEFAAGKGIDGMKRCNSEWGCRHFLGEGSDKYFQHEDMSACKSCQIAAQTDITPQNHTTYSGYVLRIGPVEEGEKPVYKAYTGVEMAVSHPAEILIRAWIKVSKDYTANQNIFRATAYRSAPPTIDWNKDKYGSADGTSDGAFPSTGDGKQESELGEWIAIETTITLEKSIDHQQDEPDADGDACDDPRADETVRMVMVSIHSHVGDKNGVIEITGLRVIERHSMGNARFKDHDERDNTLSYDMVVNGPTPIRVSEDGEMSVADADPATLGLLLNYEKMNSFTVTVRGFDKGTVGQDPSNALYVTGPYKVYLCNRNDAPVLFPATVAVPENSPFKTRVGQPIPFYEEDVGQELKFTIEGGNIPREKAQQIKPSTKKD